MMKSSVASRQNGAALITALIFMVMLTMLALGSMNTNTLEERMAANSQEINRAFQTAESGLEMAFEDAKSFSLSNTEANPYTSSTTSVGAYNAGTDFRVVYREATAPKRNASGWDSKFAFYHFDVTSTGRTASGASTTIHAGAYQVGNAGQTKGKVKYDKPK